MNLLQRRDATQDRTTTDVSAIESSRDGARGALRGLNYADGAASLAPVQLKPAGGGPVQKKDPPGAGEKDGATPELMADYQYYDDLYQGGDKGVLYDGPPKATDVTQQAEFILDCWLIGSIAALASTNPGYIQGQLMPEPDGSSPLVNVNLFYAKTPKDPMEACTITVSLASLPVYNEILGEQKQAFARTDRKSKAGKTILWVSALELAVAQLLSQKNHKGGDNEGFHQLQLGRGDVGMMVLTGKWPAAYGGEGDAAGDKKGKYTTSDGKEYDSEPAAAAMAVKKSLRDGQPVTGVMDGHVVPIMDASGGPKDADVREAITTQNPTRRETLKKANDAALSTFTVTYYNQNIHQDTPNEKRTHVLTGWYGDKGVSGKFAKGFRFGTVPGKD